MQHFLGLDPGTRYCGLSVIREDGKAHAYSVRADGQPHWLRSAKFMEVLFDDLPDEVLVGSHIAVEAGYAKSSHHLEWMRGMAAREAVRRGAATFTTLNVKAIKLFAGEGQASKRTMAGLLQQYIDIDWGGDADKVDSMWIALMMAAVRDKWFVPLNWDRLRTVRTAREGCWDIEASQGRTKMRTHPVSRSVTHFADQYQE